MSSHDPFETNHHNPYGFQEMSSAQLPPDMRRGLVHHVPALGILTIVQGSLTSLFGLGLCTMALIMPAILQAQGGNVGRPGMPAGGMPAGFEGMLFAIYGVIGLVSIVVGVLGVWGGIRILKYRGRTLGFVALSSGLLTIVGCYCLPTAIGLFIYGLIVLLNDPVKRAFEMGEQGSSSAEIQNHFARLPA